MVGGSGRRELLVSGGWVQAVALVAWHLHAAFRATQANFPAPQTLPTPPSPKRCSIRATGRARRRVSERAASGRRGGTHAWDARLLGV